MFQNYLKNLIIIGIFSFLGTSCNLISNTAEDNLKSERDTLQALVIGQQQSITTEAASLFELNGTYNSFTGTSTTVTGTAYIIAKTGLTGTWLDDNKDTGFGKSSLCQLIVEYSSGVIYTLNPENNGACYTFNSGNPGKYNKIVYFKNTAATNSYYYCTIASLKASLAEAKADTTAASSTSITSGCNGFSWSRIDKK